MVDRPGIAVLSSLALKGVLEKRRAELEQTLATRLELRFDATQAILGRLKSGEQADLLILTSDAMQTLEVKQVRELGSSGVGIAVRAGAPKPDISSVEAFKRSLAAASSVAHSKVGASGIYFAELLQRLDIQLKKRVVVEKGPVGLVVAAGDAEIGVQQLCELAPVRGIEIVGPLPGPIQRLTLFSSGIPANAANPKGALTLMDLLRSDAARVAMLEGEIQPA